MAENYKFYQSLNTTGCWLQSPENISPIHSHVCDIWLVDYIRFLFFF